jgi:hypothetical protein
MPGFLIKNSAYFASPRALRYFQGLTNFEISPNESKDAPGNYNAVPKEESTLSGGAGSPAILLAWVMTPPGNRR